MRYGLRPEGEDALLDGKRCRLWVKIKDFLGFWMVDDAVGEGEVERVVGAGRTRDGFFFGIAHSLSYGWVFCGRCFVRWNGGCFLLWVFRWCCPCLLSWLFFKNFFVFSEEAKTI